MNIASKRLNAQSYLSVTEVDLFSGFSGNVLLHCLLPLLEMQVLEPILGLLIRIWEIKLDLHFHKPFRQFLRALKFRTIELRHGSKLDCMRSQKCLMSKAFSHGMCISKAFIYKREMISQHIFSFSSYL